MRCSNFHTIHQRDRKNERDGWIFILVCHTQPFCKPAADAGRWGKKELRLFDSRHKPRKWKDRLRWLKALGLQLIFFSHPLHSHLDAMDNSLFVHSTECTNIDEAVVQIYYLFCLFIIIRLICSFNINFSWLTNDMK